MPFYRLLTIKGLQMYKMLVNQENGAPAFQPSDGLKSIIHAHRQPGPGEHKQIRQGDLF